MGGGESVSWRRPKLRRMGMGSGNLSRPPHSKIILVLAWVGRGL